MRTSIRVRADGRITVRRVVRQRVAPRVHAAQRPRRLLLQAARAAPPRRVLGPHARAHWHVRQLYHRGTNGNVARHTTASGPRPCSDSTAAVAGPHGPDVARRAPLRAAAGVGARARAAGAHGAAAALARPPAPRRAPHAGHRVAAPHLRE